MASWLVYSSPDRVVQIQALACGVASCSWVKYMYITLSASHHLGVQMGTGEFYNGGNPAVDWIFDDSLKCPYHQNFYFPIWSYISCNERLRKIFRFGYECFKTWKSYFLAVDPCCWSQHWHAQSCDVDSGTCDFRLDLSRLFYLCKFSFVVHAKCSFPACCMNY